MDTMRDLVVLLPGITGSVLQKDGKDVWAISGRSIAGFLKSAGDSLDALRLPDGYDPARPPDDGVRATRVFRDFHGVFGLGKIDGYSAVAAMVRETFDVVDGGGGPAQPANFFEFPYDWRLSSRLNGGLLKDFVETRLDAWRKHTSSDARVILLAHSMGGIVSRYYLECLEGWRDCRALVTFGTPYRGSLAAVDYLANGYKKLFLSLTGLLRSLPSVYELLPIYPAIEVDGAYARVHEVHGLPNIDRARAEAAREFHREIESAVARHLDDAAYLRDRYLVYPVVGVRQPTLQSATFDGHSLTVRSDVIPDVVDRALAGGDGTVPRVSATPLELSKAFRETFFVERHGSLQNNLYVLDDLAERLKQLQSDGLEEVRGEWAVRRTRPRPALALDLADAYVLGDEPVRFAATVDGLDPSATLRARLQRIDVPAAPETLPMTRSGATWTLRGDHLAAGTHRITVESDLLGDVGPTPVTDIFEVVAAADARGA